MNNIWHTEAPLLKNDYICAISVLRNNVVYLDRLGYSTHTKKWYKSEDPYLPINYNNELDADEHVIAWRHMFTSSLPFHDEMMILESHSEPENRVVTNTVTPDIPTLTVGMILETAANDSTDVDIIDNETGEVLAIYDGKNAIPTWFNKIEVRGWEVFANKLTLYV